MARDDNIPPAIRGPPPGATEPPEHVKKPQVYEIFHGSSNREGQDDGVVRAPSSSSPTSQLDGDGNQSQPQHRPTLKEGIGSIKADDFLSVHKIPCARQGFLTGIGAGSVVGMGRYIFGGKTYMYLPTYLPACLFAPLTRLSFIRSQVSREVQVELT